MVPQPEIGHKIARARIAAGLTQQEVADRMGVTASAVSRWENGSRDLRVEDLMALANALGCWFGDLVADHHG